MTSPDHLVCASKNSIRQISGFVLLLLVLMLMLRVFSLAYAYACACAYALVKTSLYIFRSLKN